MTFELAPPLFTLLPLGEGARRADEGRAHLHAAFGRTRSVVKTDASHRPSSGLSATFPQWGKGEI